MATHEREITQPVELCTPDGRRLNPAARGWSRTPLHTGNLRGTWGRTKRWDYWAVLGERFIVSVTYADVDYLGIAEVWWCDLQTGRTGGHAANPPFARGVALPDRPGTAPLRYSSSKLELRIVDDADGTGISARWTDHDGRPAQLDVRVALPDGHESLNVVIPWSDVRFQYTSKHQARPATGTLQLGDEVHDLAADGPAWGVLDVGRGRWPYRTRWNWGGGAGRSAEGAVVGVQFGAKWTEGTGATENGVIVDGRLTKIGAELLWDYDWDRPMRPGGSPTPTARSTSPWSPASTATARCRPGPRHRGPPGVRPVERSRHHRRGRRAPRRRDPGLRRGVALPMVTGPLNPALPAATA
jgi:hypothetical protein